MERKMMKSQYCGQKKEWEIYSQQKKKKTLKVLKLHSGKFNKNPTNRIQKNTNYYTARHKE